MERRIMQFLKSAWRHSVIDYYDKARILRILRRDTWGTVSVFIVDLNATIRIGFTNITAEYQKLRLEIGVGIDGQYKTWQMEISETLISSGHEIKKSDFSQEMQVNPEDHPQDIYVTWSNPRMTDFENRLSRLKIKIHRQKRFCDEMLPFLLPLLYCSSSCI